MKNSLHYLNSPRQYKHLGQVPITKQRSFQNLHQTSILSSIQSGLQFIFCTLCPCLTSFRRWNWDKPLRNSRSLDMTRVTWKSRFRLDCVTKTWHTAIISDLCEKKSISNLHVIGMPFSYDAVLPIAGLWFLSVSINPRNANNVFSLVVCFGSTLFPRPDRSVSLG